jgi:hypothetical protein
VAAEADLPPLDPGKTQRIAGIVAVGDVEPTRRVAHRPGHATRRGREIAQVQPGAPGDATVGALEPDQTGEAGGNADRSSAVTTRGDRVETTGDGTRGSARGPAGSGAVAPRVVRRAVQLRAVQVDAAELARRGLPREHRAARRHDPLHHRGRVGRHPVAERDRGLGVGPAFDLGELLHPDGDTAERQRHVRPCRGRPGGVTILEAHGVEGARVDGGERRLQLLDR